jgi:hypothetical protein
MDFWNWLSRTDNFLGILTTVFSGYAAYRLKQQVKRSRELARQSPRIENFQQLLKAHQGVKSSAPVAFCVSLLPNIHSIKNSVQTFLDAQRWKMPIEELNMDGINKAEDIENLVNQLNEKKRYFEDAHFTEIHLFIAGPVQAGTIIGALYDNWIPVKLYHKPTPPPPAVYEYWMPLL